MSKDNSFTLPKYAPNSVWYLDTINDVIEASAGFVNLKVAHHLMKLIATGWSRLRETDPLCAGVDIH